jgi:hypothetical protein
VNDGPLDLAAREIVKLQNLKSLYLKDSGLVGEGEDFLTCGTRP